MHSPPPALDELTRLLPPPTGSSGGPIDWSVVDVAVGTSLPPDYKAFCDTYGPGSIDDFLVVYHPTTSNQYRRLQPQIEGGLWALRYLREHSEDIPYPISPEPGGVLPWGRTDNGDVGYWRTVGPPVQWTVVVNESRGPVWVEFSGTLVEFLLAVLTRRFVCPVFPDDFPSSSPAFEPAAERG